MRANNKKSKIQKTSASTTTVRSLVVIDNQPLRLKSIRLAQKWLDKMEDIERSAGKFRDVDLKLYTDWYQLTLSPLLSQIEESRQEFLILAQFHNRMLMVAHDKNISVPEAYIFLIDEDERYKNGNQNVRAEIEAARATRATRMDEALKESSGRYDNEEEPADETLESLQQENERIQEQREEYRSNILYYESLNDRQLVQLLRHSDESFEFVVEAVAILMATARVDLLRNIWKYVPNYIKIQINRQSKVELGLTIERLMDETELRAQMRERILRTEKSNEDLESAEFQDDFFNEFKKQSGPKSKSVGEADLLRIKSLFRRIVRRIHPDHLAVEDSKELKSWFQMIWKKVGEAHESNDLAQLTALDLKTAIVLKQYDELSVSELNSAATSLESEFHEFSAQFADLKESPAWNFSKLKDYNKVKKAQEKPLLHQHKNLTNDIEKIKKQRAEIEYVVGLIKSGQLKMKRKKKRRRSV
jgi:hypothetical protein